MRKSIVVLYALTNLLFNVNFENNIPEHVKIFNHAQQIQSLGEALKYTASYIDGIKYVSDLENYGIKNYYASLKIINERKKMTVTEKL